MTAHTYVTKFDGVNTRIAPRPWRTYPPQEDSNPEMIVSGPWQGFRYSPAFSVDPAGDPTLYFAGDNITMGRGPPSVRIDDVVRYGRTFAPATILFSCFTSTRFIRSQGDDYNLYRDANCTLEVHGINKHGQGDTWHCVYGGRPDYKYPSDGKTIVMDDDVCQLPATDFRAVQMDLSLRKNWDPKAGHHLIAVFDGFRYATNQRCS